MLPFLDDTLNVVYNPLMAQQSHKWLAAISQSGVDGKLQGAYPILWQQLQPHPHAYLG